MAQPCGEGKLALSHWHSQEKREIGELRPDGQLFFGEPPGWDRPISARPQKRLRKTLELTQQSNSAQKLTNFAKGTWPSGCPPPPPCAASFPREQVGFWDPPPTATIVQSNPTTKGKSAGGGGKLVPKMASKLVFRIWYLDMPKKRVLKNGRRWANLGPFPSPGVRLPWSNQFFELGFENPLPDHLRWRRGHIHQAMAWGVALVGIQHGLPATNSTLILIAFLATLI